jgi:carboxymethylenebutenolidase
MSVTRETRSVRTPDGECGVHLFRSAPVELPGPAVIFFMDAGGIRPSLFAMAERIAGHGYTVALPDLYYRAGPYEPADAKAAFVDGPELDRLKRLARTITNVGIERDIGAVLAMLETDGATAIGCVGYCMGGRCALIAAGAFGPRIAAAASIHGARLATDALDSPHLLAGSVRAEIYVAVAQLDPYFTDDERARLASAFVTAGVRHTIEDYAGVEHGFAVPDIPVHDNAAAERHWKCVLELFARNLRSH